MPLLWPMPMHAPAAGVGEWAGFGAPKWLRVGLLGRRLPTCMQAPIRALSLQEEVAAAESAIKQLGGRALALELVDSHSHEGQRTALVVAKAAPTPSKFPRQAGTPNKNPLS
jgi:hypothetical protein